jgi:hypothetical protein
VPVLLQILFPLLKLSPGSHACLQKAGVLKRLELAAFFNLCSLITSVFHAFSFSNCLTVVFTSNQDYCIGLHLHAISS